MGLDRAFTRVVARYFVLDAYKSGYQAPHSLFHRNARGYRQYPKPINQRQA